MVLAPFELLKGEGQRADIGWRYPLHGSGLATNGLVREGFEKILHPEVAVPLQSELLVLAVEFGQGDIVAAHDGARDLLHGQIVVASIERVERDFAADRPRYLEAHLGVAHGSPFCWP
jgi:hypothetical protein